MKEWMRVNAGLDCDNSSWATHCARARSLVRSREAAKHDGLKTVELAPLMRHDDG